MDKDKNRAIKDILNNGTKEEKEELNKLLKESNVDLNNIIKNIENAFPKYKVSTINKEAVELLNKDFKLEAIYDIYNEINDLKIKQNKIGIKDIITWIIMGLTMIIAIIALFI